MTQRTMTPDYPFQRVLVDHSYQGTTRIWWDLHPYFADSAPYSYQLQFSPTGAPDGDDWQDVGGLVIDATALEDTQQRQFGKGLTGHYRVVLTTGDGKCYRSRPVPLFGALSQRDWTLARDIIRRERVRDGFAARSGWLLKRKRAGQRCQRCLDPLTGEVTDAACPECFGTGFQGGYHPPIRMDAVFGPQPIQEAPNAASPPGGQKQVPNRIRLAGSPLTATYDVWVDEKDDRRWIVQSVAQAAIMRGYPLVIEAQVDLLPASDVAYKVPVPGQDASAYPAYRRDVGDDSVVYVDHNYGADDALSYVDQCNEGVQGATVKAYLESDYNAGNTGDQYVQAQTTTTADGRFVEALPLCPGNTYVLVYEKPGQFGPDTVTVNT